MRRTRLSLLMSAALASGCVGEAYQVTATGYATTPDLVEVAPGVQVIADYDEPMFFADGAYWWFFDDAWYRSGDYTTGWIYVATPPLVITSIHAPHLYRHYRPPGYFVHHRPMPAHQVRRPNVRDHRATRDHRR